MTTDQTALYDDLDTLIADTITLCKHAEKLSNNYLVNRNMRAASYLRQAPDHANDAIRCLRIAQNFLKKEQ